MSTQEQTDFKLALKLQQQEMESRSEYEISPCYEPITTPRVNNLIWMWTQMRLSPVNVLQNVKT